MRAVMKVIVVLMPDRIDCRSGVFYGFLVALIEENFKKRCCFAAQGVGAQAARSVPNRAGFIV